MLSCVLLCYNEHILKIKNVVPSEKNKKLNILHPYLSIAVISREMPLFSVLKINLRLKRKKEKPANALPLVKGDSGCELSNFLGSYVSVVAIGGPV